MTPVFKQQQKFYEICTWVVAKSGLHSKLDDYLLCVTMALCSTQPEAELRTRNIS
jgi:hypothetical protein